jgi:predicted metal-dependent hydrolase
MPTLTKPAPGRYEDIVEDLTLPKFITWTIEFHPRRKRIEVQFFAGCKVVFRLPYATTPAHFHTVANRMRPTIVTKAAKTAAKVPTTPVSELVQKDLVNGEGFELFGRSYRLRLVTAGPVCELRPQPLGQVRADGSGSMGSDLFLCLRADMATAETVIEWYRRQLAVFLDETLPPLAARHGVPLAGAAVGRPGLSWRVRAASDGNFGSWATYGRRPDNIRFTWHIAQLPREDALHTVRHELAHATRPGGKPHGPEWQAAMDRICGPGWVTVEKRTRKGPPNLWYGATNPTPYTTTSAALAGWGSL